MVSADLSRWTPRDHEQAARLAALLVRAERRYSRRAKAYEDGRRSTTLVDTGRLARLLVDADRLVRDLAKVRP